MDVVVIPTGTANVASVLAGLRAAGADPRVGTDVTAEAVVLPGVGAFGAGRAALDALGLVEPLQERVRAGSKTLAVCLGLQLLAEASDEDPGVPGLGVIPGVVRRFSGVRVPQLGWNEVLGDGALLRPGYAYFANSYRLVEPPAGWTVATADHGGPFVAAIERGRVLGCQFHPELSGAWGIALLSRWLSC